MHEKTEPIYGGPFGFLRLLSAAGLRGNVPDGGLRRERGIKIINVAT